MGLIRHALLSARDIHQDLKELPQTLTSWDKCMYWAVYWFCKDELTLVQAWKSHSVNGPPLQAASSVALSSSLASGV